MQFARAYLAANSPAAVTVNRSDLELAADCLDDLAGEWAWKADEPRNGYDKQLADVAALAIRLRGLLERR